jgi:peptidoglycan-associated lipoprotein
MRKSTIVIGIVFLGVFLGAACSHQQTAPAKPPVQAKAQPQRLPEPRIIPPEPEAPAASTAQSAPENPSIYFDFDSHLLRSDDRSTLQKVAAAAKGKKTVRIEGNCDERGTAEYNLALGDARAREAERYLERLGIPKSRLKTVTYGSERPRTSGHDESAWSQNRRDDFIIQ